MKRKFSALMFLLVAVLLLAACSGSSGGAKNKLTIMGKKTDLEKSFMVSIFEQYEKETGNDIETIPIEDSEFEKVAAERYAAGDGADILMHFHNADLDRFDVENNFCFLEDEDWVSDLENSAKEYCTDKNGRLLGLPFWESSVSGCYYNKTILDSLGLKPAYTQQEFDVLCQVLKDTGYTPICWPGNGCSWMPQFAMDPIFADDHALLEQLNQGEIAYADIPAMTDMVTWLGNAEKSGWFGSNYHNVGWDDISSVMGSGQAVMVFIWDTWFYTDFSETEKYSIDDFALMPVFMNTAPEGTYEGGNLNMMMVNKNSENREMALDFLSFCATPEHYNAAFSGISTVSCFKQETANIESQMVTDAKASIAEKERVSTAATRIAGYSADDMVTALNSFFRGETDVAGCVQQMDDYRLEEIREHGTKELME